jgi:hypothetical protein
MHRRTEKISRNRLRVLMLATLPVARAARATSPAATAVDGVAQVEVGVQPAMCVTAAGGTKRRSDLSQ